MGGWIMAAGPVIERERRLYADVERYDEGVSVWNGPRGLPPLGDRRPPDVLRLVMAMRNLGLLTPAGMRAVRTVWNATELADDATVWDMRDLTHETLKGADAAGVISEAATEDDVRTVRATSPFPMWDFDLDPLRVPDEELQAERKRDLAAGIDDR